MQGSLSELAERHKGESITVAVGLRPSGYLHVGNIAAVAAAALLARETGPASRVALTVCDLDPPDKALEFSDTDGYVSFAHQIPAPRRGYANLLEFAREQIGGLVRDVECALDVGIDVRLLSDVQRDEGFRHGLRALLDDPHSMMLLNEKAPQGFVYAWPVCPGCGTKDMARSRYADGVLASSCKNTDCEQGMIEARVDDRSRDIAVHYLIDPIRDRTVLPFAAVHVFGGDYAEINELSGIRKADITQFYTAAASGEPAPDLLLTPLMQDMSGRKISKSLGNGFEMGSLRNALGRRGYVEKIAMLVKAATDGGDTRIPYEALRAFLSR